MCAYLRGRSKSESEKLKGRLGDTFRGIPGNARHSKHGRVQTRRRLSVEETFAKLSTLIGTEQVTAGNESYFY